jgi:hypothetical protein
VTFQFVVFHVRRIFACHRSRIKGAVRLPQLLDRVTRGLVAPAICMFDRAGGT